MSIYRLAVYRLALRMMRFAFGRVTPAMQPTYVYAAQLAIAGLFAPDQNDPVDDTDDDMEPVQTINGPVAWRDIPRDASGDIKTAWLIANCPCPDHELARLTQRATRDEQ